MDQKPPLGFFRTFVLQRSGDHKHKLDLKLNGIGPIVNAARMFAIDAGIESTNTIDRLLALEAMDYGVKGLWKDLQESLEFLLLFKLEHQLQQTKDGQPLNDYVNPATLTQLHRTLLKEAFQVSARAQSLVKSKFQSWVWAQLE
jgi:CBS domain-containing protein